MGFIEAIDASYKIPGGRVLFDGVRAQLGVGYPNDAH